MKIILITSIEALKNRKVKVSSVVSQTLEKVRVTISIKCFKRRTEKSLSLNKNERIENFININIQYFEENDAEEIVKLIHRAMFETNISDYSKEDLVKDAENITVSSIIERASWTHFMYLEMKRLSLRQVQLVLIGIVQ